MKCETCLLGHLYKGIKVILIFLIVFSCKQTCQENKSIDVKLEQPEYYNFRPELEKMYGYTQAVRVGNHLKIGGVISIDDQGNPIAKDNYLLQMKNCYDSLEE